MPKSKVPANKYFRKEDVNVRYHGHGKTVKAQRVEPLPALAALPALAGVFKPFQLVINLKLTDTTQKGKKVLKFDPPIEVNVRYTAAHLALAKKAGGKLKLAYWDGKKWVLFTKAAHKYHLEKWDPAKGKGLCVVHLSVWGDPPIGIGT